MRAGRPQARAPLGWRPEVKLRRPTSGRGYATSALRVGGKMFVCLPSRKAGLAVGGSSYSTLLFVQIFVPTPNYRFTPAKPQQAGQAKQPE